MILRVPDYFYEFQCIAQNCKDNCCIGWEIDIDDDTYEYYKHVKGKLGERFQKYIKQGDSIHFTLKNRCCPFLNQDHLCDICFELGEEALCEVCTEYPRFTVEYGNVREKSLALSCEEVGRILFSKKESITFIEKEFEVDTEEFDDCNSNYIYIRQARDFSIELLQNRKKHINYRMIDFLYFSNVVQLAINENNEADIPEIIQQYRMKQFDKSELEPFTERKLHQAFCNRLDVFDGMELLDDEWRQYMKDLHNEFYSNKKVMEYSKKYALYDNSQDHEKEYEHLMVYFTYRYLIRSVYDNRFLDKAKSAIVAYLMIHDMDVLRYARNQKYTQIDRIDIARIFSKEVEHSQENIDYLEEAMFFEDAFALNLLCQNLIVY